MQRSSLTDMHRFPHPDGCDGLGLIEEAVPCVAGGRIRPPAVANPTQSSPPELHRSRRGANPPRQLVWALQFGPDGAGYGVIQATFGGRLAFGKTDNLFTGNARWDLKGLE